MIVAAIILLTVSALIRCISKAASRDNVDKQSQSMVERFYKERIFLVFFLTGSGSSCLIGEMERLEGHESCYLRKRTRFSQPFF
jgi:hypothetical protein